MTTKNEDQKTMLSVADVGRLLKISTRSVYRLSDSGQMPRPLKIGRLVRWNPKAIDTWLEMGCPVVRTAKGVRS